MALSPNTDQNLLFGKSQILFEKAGTSGFFHIGNVPACELNIEIEKYEHYSSMSDIMYKDVEKDKSKKLTGSLDMEEVSKENIALAYNSGDPSILAQTAGAVSGQSVTTIADRFVSTGNLQCTFTKISIGAVTGGPFLPGDVITGGTSSETATVVGVKTGYLEVISDTGLVSGETITGGTSTATAAISGVRVMTGIILADSATMASITATYVHGTDYTYIAEGGMVRELTGGSISANTAYVYADKPAKSRYQFAVLSGSSVTGRIMIIGTTADGYGPKLIFTSHDNDKCKLTCKSALKFVSEEPEPMSFDIEILGDTVNYPNDPFGILEMIE